MADWMDPAAAMATNPYLLPAAAPPDKWAVLGNLLMGAGMGISQADASGRGWASGIGPGLMTGMQLVNNERRLAEDQGMRRAQFGRMLEHSRTQDEATRVKMRMAEEEAKRRGEFGKSIQTALGFNVQPSTVQMGPDSYDTRLAGFEGGNKNGGMVFNELGSGAFGPYQFTQPTWDTVRAKSPDLNLPPDMTQASRAQHDAAAQRLKAMNGEALSAAGIPVTAPNLYLAHRFGPSGAQAVVKADPNKLLADVLPIDWQRQNLDMRGQTAGGFVRLANERMRGVDGGGSPAVQGDATGGNATQGLLAQLDPSVRAIIGATAAKDPEKAAQMLIDALKNVKKEDAWVPLGEGDGKMFLGQAYDPTKAYQRNKITGKIEPIGGSLVNINNQSESTFTKQVAEQDAKRLGEIQENTQRVNDTANKVRLAADLMAKTYTGPGAKWANVFFETLGGLGVESAANKANAAAAATGLIAELTPRMRVPGSGATSDFEMRVFASALPALFNLPGGNEMVAAYWRRIADRATAVQAIAEKHAGESKGLTGTKWSEEVKALGPLFTKEEIAQMQEAAKGSPKPGPDNRKPLDEILQGAEQNRTPMPGGRKPLGDILGAP